MGMENDMEDEVPQKVVCTTKSCMFQIDCYKQCRLHGEASKALALDPQICGASFFRNNRWTFGHKNCEFWK